MGKVLQILINLGLCISRNHKSDYTIIIININRKEDSDLHGCYTVLSSKYLLIYRRVATPQRPAVKKSGMLNPEDEGIMTVRYVG